MSLYGGSAAYYSIGRMPYPPELASTLQQELALDGSGRLLDVGCGPGSLTLLLAPLFESAVGIDADSDMIATATRASDASNVDFRCLRAEDLSADLGRFRVVTFAQSFHWMDQLLVAQRVKELLAPGGAWVHVGAMTHRGVDGDDPLPHPRPPWDAIDELIADYLGPREGGNKAGEEDVMREAGYFGPARITVGGGQVVERTTDELVASVFSLSYAAPHRFGVRLPDFDRDLRDLLGGGPFCEQRRETELVIWTLYKC